MLVIVAVFIKITFPQTRRFLRVVDAGEVQPLLRTAVAGVKRVQQLTAESQVAWLDRFRGPEITDVFGGRLRRPRVERKKGGVFTSTAGARPCCWSCRASPPCAARFRARLR